MICPEAIDMIKHFEGLGDGDRSCPGLQPYICPAGVWTIGYGSTYDLEGQRINGKTAPISEKSAEELLMRDIYKFSSSVDRLVSVRIDEYQRGALTSFAFNLGAGALQASTLLRRINGLDWDDVPRQFNRWILGGGIILNGLIRRRRAEADLWGYGNGTSKKNEKSAVRTKEKGP